MAPKKGAVKTIAKPKPKRCPKAKAIFPPTPKAKARVADADEVSEDSSSVTPVPVPTRGRGRGVGRSRGRGAKAADSPLPKEVNPSGVQFWAKFTQKVKTESMEGWELHCLGGGGGGSGHTSQLVDDKVLWSDMFQTAILVSSLHLV